jgi:hypothetical protein
MEKPEYILCAAIWYKDLATPQFNPVNVNRGIVFSGHRHPYCLYQMVAMTGLYQHQAGREVQGFLTSKNRFVDRIEGGKIAIQSGQIEKLSYGQNQMFSEDLY